MLIGLHSKYFGDSTWNSIGDSHCAKSVFFGLFQHFEIMQKRTKGTSFVENSAKKVFWSSYTFVQIAFSQDFIRILEANCGGDINDRRRRFDSFFESSLGAFASDTRRFAKQKGEELFNYYFLDANTFFIFQFHSDLPYLSSFTFSSQSVASEEV